MSTGGINCDLLSTENTYSKVDNLNNSMVVCGYTQIKCFFARSITLINTDRHQFSKYSGWLESRTEKWEQSVSMTCLDLVTNVYRRTSRCYRNQFWILQGESQVILILSINSYEHVVLTVYLWLCYYMVWQNICATLADHTQKGISTVKNKVKS